MQQRISTLDKEFARQSYDIKKITYQFKNNIINNIFFINIATLRLNSNLIEFNITDWNQRPWTFCSDTYNQKEYYPIILLVNNINSFLDFLPEKFSLVNQNGIHKRAIIAPYESEILKVLSYV